jgi:hypothetical protein
MTEWSELSSWATVKQGHTGQVRRPCALTHSFSLVLHPSCHIHPSIRMYIHTYIRYDTYIEHLLLWVGLCGDWGACGTYTLYAIWVTGWGACDWHVYPHTEWGRVDVCRVIASSWVLMTYVAYEVLSTYAAHEVFSTYAASTYATALHRIKFEALETVAKTLVSLES